MERKQEIKGYEHINYGQSISGYFSFCNKRNHQLQIGQSIKIVKFVRADLLRIKFIIHVE